MKYFYSLVKELKMPIFNYTGRDANGKQIQGTLNAQTREGVAQKLMEGQIVPIKITLNSARRFSWNIDIFPVKLKMEEMVTFCRQMEIMMRVGISIVDSLAHIGQTSSSPVLKKILPQMAESISSGSTLTEALKKHPRYFNHVFVNVISAGESSGRLEQGFNQLSSYMQLAEKTTKRIKSATRYPMIVMSTAIIAVVVVNFFVIPTFSNMFAKLGEDLPLPTLIMMSTSSFMKAHWLLILLCAVLLLLGFKVFKKSPKGALLWSRIVLRLPVAGKIIRNALLGRFARMFAMIIETGIPLIKGIDLVAQTIGNEHMTKKVYDMKDSIERGESLTKAASQTKIFPPMIIQMLNIGEETGAIDTLLTEVAQYYEGEVEYDLNRLSDLIEPILLLMMGSIVLMLALGVFLPMWGMISAMGKGGG
jgi:MSHA biogenesis protein MshG